MWPFDTLSKEPIGAVCFFWWGQSPRKLAIFSLAGNAADILVLTLFLYLGAPLLVSFFIALHLLANANAFNKSSDLGSALQSLRKKPPVLQKRKRKSYA